MDEQLSNEFNVKYFIDVVTEISPMERAEQRIPTLFTGSLDATEKPLSRRRHIRRNLFEDEIPTGKEIFSYQGKRGVNIQRHRDNVTVFPSGCMGTFYYNIYNLLSKYAYANIYHKYFPVFQKYTLNVDYSFTL